MNGTWFPWSGTFYGGGKTAGHKDGQTLYEGPEQYKRAFRYVVDRVRARKATNILWGFHANNFSTPRTAWNRMSNYYPGADYVDWLGLSAYGKMDRSWAWNEFNNTVAEPYAELCALDAVKPVFIAEWGVGEFPPADKAGFIAAALRDLPGEYPRVKLAVYWHERWENKDGSFSNLRVNSSPEAIGAYRTGIASPLWIGRPQLERQAAKP
jgi:beta-mannanase